MVAEKGSKDERAANTKTEKRRIAGLKAALDVLLEQPVPWSDGPGVSGGGRRKGLVVVAR